MRVMMDASVMETSSITQKHVSPSEAVINVKAGLCLLVMATELERAGLTLETSSGAKVMNVEGSPCLLITAVALA